MDNTLILLASALSLLSITAGLVKYRLFLWPIDMRLWYGITYGALAIGTIQGDVGPLSSMKDIRVRGALIVGLFFLAVISHVRGVPAKNGLKVLWITGGLCLFAISGICTLVVYQLSSSQILVFALYLAPLFALLLSSFEFVKSAFHGLWAGCLVQMSAALIFGPYVLTLSGVQQLSGGLQPNVMALVCVMTLLVGFWHVVRPSGRMLFGVLLVLSSSIAIFLCVSRTGMLSALLGLALLVLLEGGRRTKGVIGTVGALTVLVYVLSDGLKGAVEDWFVRGDADSISSLTGRTDIWKLAIEYWNQRPIFGWGFGALYSSGSSAGSFLSKVRGVNAHNAVLQLLVETGIVGLTLMLLVLVLATTAMLRRSYLDRPLIISVFGVVLFNAIGSAGFATIGLAWSVLAVLLVWAEKSGPAILVESGVFSEPVVTAHHVRSVSG